jgi:putative PEP-CTERM system histidine kinase
MNLYVAISLTAFVLSLILAITIFSLAPRRLIGKAFVTGIALLMVIEFCLFMIFLQKDKVMFWGKIAMASFCFLPPTWALISMVYARSNYRELLKTRIWYLSLLYGLGLIFFIMVWKVDFFTVAKSFPEDIFLISSVGKYFLIFALLVTVLILINFENTLRLTKISSRKGKKMKMPLYILTGAFLFWVYAISQMLMYSRISRNLAFMGFIVIIIANLVLVFYSIKYGLMQLEVDIGREVVYSSAMIFIVGVYLLVIGIVGKIVQYAGGSVNLFLTFLAALIAFFILLATLVSKSLKERIKFFVDRNFYKNRYDYREQWGKFSESLSAVLNFDEVLTTIIENIAAIFSTNRIVIFLADESNGIFVARKSKNMSELQDIQFNQNSQFINWFHRLGEAVQHSTIVAQGGQIGITEQELENLEKLGSAVLTPLIVQQKLMGLVALGEKESDNPFSKEDFDLLETIANQSSVAILNAKLNENLMVSREMESFHKLSSFILHDLKNSVSMLSMVVKNTEDNWENQEFQKDMLQTISAAVTKMKTLISKISTLPDKMVLKKQVVQINDVIRKVIQQTKIEELKHVKLKTNLESLSPVAVDAEQIQKVIENLVINALEALPDGGSLSISTRTIGKNHESNSGNGRIGTENGFVEIVISDTGFGMSVDFIRHRLFKPFQTTKKKGLGIGLYHCKEIIVAHDGTVDVESHEKKGTSFKILLPLSNDFESVPGGAKKPSENEVIFN